MIKLLKGVFYIIWRIWFYVLVAIPIIVLFPILVILSSSEKFYPQFFWIARNIWANIILYGMGFIPLIKKEQKIVKGKSYMLIANHTCMTDIMLMLKASKNPFVFVGKKELAKIPVFGFFYKRVCILVDRENARSRSTVYLRAQRRLKQGLSICIFPEGGVPDEKVLLDDFKDGAFRLAIEHQIPIVPMTFLDNKKRFSYNFFSGSPGRMRVKIHRFIETAGLQPDSKEKIKTQAREIIYNELVSKTKKSVSKI
ncbi:lysophospholipid acyltransferase family protein [Abyssalbus ytuae]|uniref:1-acyl-sn-glycerol-3-phosphate acyltransferase n=1 Tax=Abyssalbus ytuae TaxID=2926907 RepID=A0A9E7CTD2_9FLAO|nr:lysophospholipid acyltransferase family protein [Abyssalbus ytuae]UOB15957.1 1-acyl-sn-glycerol-3-phosphate acyltransferase [Abyssalbus ytuae]